MTGNSGRIAAAGLMLAFLWWEGGGAVQAEEGSSTQLDFQLLRNGEPFGRHGIRIEHRADGTVLVENRADASVMMGPLKLFKYSYRSREVWQADHLLSMTSETDDDGTEVDLVAEAGSEGLRIDGPEGSALLPSDLLPTSFWTTAEMDRGLLLDTRTGHLDQVTTVRLADEPSASGMLAHYRMTGDLISDLWYDGQGLLARARFEARGSVIDYIKERPSSRLVAGGHEPHGGS